MNDAGGRAAEGEFTPSDPLAWFQVEANPVSRRRPLPIQAFLQCSIDVCDRLEPFDLKKVLLLLPVQRLAVPRGGAVAARNIHWFETLDPRNLVNVEMRLAAGKSAANGSLSDAVSDFIELEQTVLRQPVRAVQSTFDTVPPFDDSFWDGPATETAALRGELVAWEPDAIAWLGQAMAECAATNGISSPILMSVAMIR
ncbi:MAG: hypothetical protein QM650_14235 [Microlunatus sp.]